MLKIKNLFTGNYDECDSDLPFEVLEEKHARWYPRLRKLDPGEYGDVYLSRIVSDPRFNTNIRAHYMSFDQMSWGYKGQGPYTLSFSILYHFSDYEFAKENVMDFMQEVISKLDMDSDHIIRKSYIEHWIKIRKNLNEGGRIVLFPTKSK